MTLSAADNLTALQTRSARIPLRETADTVARRLADHLRELGWHVTATEAPEEPLSPEAKEGSRGVSDDHGYLAAYRVAVNNDLSKRWTMSETPGYPNAGRPLSSPAPPMRRV